MMREPSLGPCSLSTWPEGVESWLPKTDLVGLVLRLTSKETLLVKWGDLVSVCPAILRPIPSYEPALFKHKGWPSESQLAELRELALLRKVGK
ncbi:hypothetical protein BH09MYX1_BH09MYX1_57210 [soil metagenome]